MNLLPINLLDFSYKTVLEAYSSYRVANSSFTQ